MKKKTKKVGMHKMPSGMPMSDKEMTAMMKKKMAKKKMK